MSADAKLVLCVAVPVIAVLILELAICFLLLAAYRRRNKSLRTLCGRYKVMAKTAAAQLRRAQSAHYFAETQAAAEMADKDRELKVNRELMRQYDRSRRAREGV